MNLFTSHPYARQVRASSTQRFARRQHPRRAHWPLFSKDLRPFAWGYMRVLGSLAARHQNTTYQERRP
jgi:hypothetical protein